jgi:CBS domain-containing protein
MTLSTRPTGRFSLRLPGLLSPLLRPRDPEPPVLTSAVLDPLLLYVARPVRPVGPETRIAEVMEALRMSPYRAVPVVANPDDEQNGQHLLGMVSEATLVNSLLAARTVEERAALRGMPAREVMESPRFTLMPAMRASEAATFFDLTGSDVLPVVEGDGGLLGLASRSDLVQELARPFRPPLVGGMATPIGVYLTTGAVSGGAGMGALFLTGLAMSAVFLLTFFLGQPLTGLVARLPDSVRVSADLLLQSVVQTGLFLLLIRLSPMAGYHAAEHQVVHAIEKGEPLLVRTVRAMPRVHPRCGTNLVAGGMLLGLIGTILQPLLGSVGYLLAGLVALAYWRTFGGWLQQYLTTRPATDAQIESGIRAAKALLEQHGRNPYAPVRPHVRLWRMGFLQILTGFVAGYALVFLATWLFPALHGPLKPYLEDLW